MPLSFLTNIPNPFATMTKDELSTWAQRHRLSKYLPFLAYDPEKKLYYNKDDTVGFIFSCIPLLGADHKIENTLAGLLDLLPPHGVLSFSIMSSPYITPITNAFKAIKVRAQNNPLLKEAVENYAKFLEESVNGMPHLMGTPLRRFEIIVSFKIPQKKLGDLDISEFKVAFKEGLQGSYLNPTDLEPPRLLHLLFYIFNGYFDDNITWNEFKPISDQIILADTCIHVGSDFLKVGSNHFKCITPKQIPEEVSCNKIGKLFGGERGPLDDSNQISTHFLYTTVITYDPGIANRIRSKAALFKKQYQGEDSILSQTIGEYAQEHIWAVNVLEKGGKFLYSMPIFWVWDKSHKRTKSAVERVKRLMSSQGFIPQEERVILLPLFISALPFGFYHEKGNMENLDRYFLADTEDTAKTLPIVGDYRGGGSPHVIFVSRKGQVVPFDPFDDIAKNKNICVMGTTGGGKSFTLNLYVLSMFASGAYVRIFDLGYSYQKQCKLHGKDGYYLDLGENVICLNPFSFIPTDEANAQERKHYLDAIASLVGVMVYASTDRKPSETEINLIKGATNFAWNDSGPDADIDLIYRYLATFPALAGEEIRDLCPEKSKCGENLRTTAQSLAFNLTQWTSKGTFGEWFNGRATVDLVSNPFIVLELEKLQRIKALFRVVSLAVINATTAVLYLLPRKIPKVMIFEECGVTLKGNDLFKDVVEEAYRRGRKNNVSTVTVFQSPLDLKRLGPVGEVILGNADFHLYLPSPDYEKAIQEKILPLEGFESLLSSIQSARPRYTEIGLKTPYGVGVVRVLVDSFLYWLCTSDPKDWTYIQERMQASGKNLVDTIKELAKERDEKILPLLAAN